MMSVRLMTHVAFQLDRRGSQEYFSQSAHEGRVHIFWLFEGEQVMAHGPECFLFVKDGRQPALVDYFCD
jgi:hypothetical protein